MKTEYELIKPGDAVPDDAEWLDVDCVTWRPVTYCGRGVEEIQHRPYAPMRKPKVDPMAKLAEEAKKVLAALTEAVKPYPVKHGEVRRVGNDMHVGLILGPAAPTVLFKDQFPDAHAEITGPKPTQIRLNDGLRALDAVKHCEDKMDSMMAAHDKLMRNTPPNQWTHADIAAMISTANHVNG